MVLENLTLTDGHARKGGAVYVGHGSSVSIVNSTLADNHATEAGGAVWGGPYGNSLRIANSLISHNTSEGDGGGVVGQYSVWISNSTIHGNTAVERGGGVFGYLNLFNSTVTENEAGVAGGGLYTEPAYIDTGGFYSQFEESWVLNSVVAENTAPSAPDAAVVERSSYDYSAGEYERVGLLAGNSFFGSPVSLTDDAGGNVLDGGDPMLGGLADNGGGVLTRAPQPGSPLIDAGSIATTASDWFDLDGDGDVREKVPVDGRLGPRLVGAEVDIGAVEAADAPCGVTLVGGPGDNELTGTICDDTLTGLGGDDILDADLGDDVAYGGAGNDRVQGGAGDDRVYGGAGDDFVARGSATII